MLSTTVKRTSRVAVLLAGAVAAAALTLTGVADAATHRVAGEQVAIQADATGAGEYKMRGGSSTRRRWPRRSCATTS
jgi:hypothetical protein